MERFKIASHPRWGFLLVGGLALLVVGMLLGAGIRTMGEDSLAPAVVSADNAADDSQTPNGVAKGANAFKPKTLGGVVNSNGTTQTIPPGVFVNKGGAGQYFINCPPGTWKPGGLPVPVFMSFNNPVTSLGVGGTPDDGSEVIEVVFSTDTLFTFVVTGSGF